MPNCIAVMQIRKILNYMANAVQVLKLNNLWAGGFIKSYGSSFTDGTGRTATHLSRGCRLGT